MRIYYILLASYSYHTSNLAGLFSLFCQATSLDIYANIPVCTFMRIIAIVNSSKKRKGTSKKKICNWAALSVYVQVNFKNC